MNHPSLLDALWRTGALRTLDHALAQSLRRLDPDTPDTVLAAAALVSLAVSAGHAGFDPADPQRLVDAPLDWPTTYAWRTALESSPCVAPPHTAAPDSTPDASATANAWTAVTYMNIVCRRIAENKHTKPYIQVH